MSRPADRTAELEGKTPAALPSAGQHGGALALDLALAKLMENHALAAGVEGMEARQLAITTALLAQERGRGHSCLRLDTWAGRRFTLLQGTAAVSDASPVYPMPSLAPWLELLRSSHLVGDGQQPTPLVLDSRQRLYLYRYWTAEQRLSHNLRRRLDDTSLHLGNEDAEVLAPLFRRLFPPPSDGTVDHQAMAAALALDRGLCLISGGPGTGKTTTVSRILALWLSADPDLHIALAAPTGKAAARLGESIGQQVASLGLADDLATRLPTQASTLHRLLGYNRYQQRFRHRPEHPLPCDVLVVDEASMVDLLMMDVLVAALAEGTRLVLLGDRDQLTSVETGFVFGDLCQGAAAAGLSSAFRQRFALLTGTPPATGGEDPGEVDGPTHQPLRDSAVELRTNYRFRHQPGIGALAQAIRQQDVHGALAVLDDPSFDDVHRRSHSGDSRQLLAPIYPHLRSIFEAEDAADALGQLSMFRLLVATRRGPWGLEQLNRRVEDLLWAEPGLIDDAVEVAVDAEHGQRWYHGRPIMVTHNDYQVGLFNGDLGLCWRQDGQLRAVFSDGQDGLRVLPLAKLPPHDTAWAMTVHKSQGSEFDHVLLVLPQQDSPLLARELLYTAVTRARKRVTVVAEASLLETAIGRRTRRASGLLDALLGPDADLSAEERRSPDDDATTASKGAEPSVTKASVAEPSAAEPPSSGAAQQAPSTPPAAEPKAASQDDEPTAPPRRPKQLSLFPED